MKTLKKIVVVILALAMVLGMNAVAFADGNNTYTGSGNTLATGVAGGTTIPLNKTIVFFNANGSDVYEPNLKYTYTVAPQDPNGATVTDDGSLNVIGGTPTPVTVTVNQGPAGGVYFASGANEISFSSGNAAVTTNSKGVEVEKSTNLSVDLTKFSHAGVYRYVITETTTEAAKNAVGVVQGSEFDNKRYLDVYIGNDTSGLKMVGAVIFKDVSTSGGTPGTSSITTTTGKTTGFEPGTNGTPGTTDYTSDKTVDTYTTYDFEVKKEVSGSMADKTFEFPFYVNITNTISGAKYTYYDDPGTGAGAAETISGTSIAKGTNASTSALKLKHGDYIKFVGVPSNTSSALSIDITEWNTSVDEYTPSVAATNGSPAMASGAKMTALTGTDSVTTFDLKANDVADQILTITNTIAEISPTGYAARFAPYALMLLAGVALLILGRRFKSKKEEN